MKQEDIKKAYTEQVGNIYGDDADDFEGESESDLDDDASVSSG